MYLVICFVRSREVLICNRIQPITLRYQIFLERMLLAVNGNNGNLEAHLVGHYLMGPLL